MGEMHTCGEDCVLRYLVDEQGMEPQRAFQWALEYTCFPMDCTTALEQAKQAFRTTKGAGNG